MADSDDSEYPRLTQLADWPAGSIEASRILLGDEVYWTGPKSDCAGDGVLRHPVYVKPYGYTGSPPWSPIRPTPLVATIYFVGPADGPIKIGYASRLQFRLRDLRLANAFPLELWASIDGPPQLERDYHKRFAAHRLHGEWFERHPDILAEIDRLNAPASCIGIAPLGGGR